MQRKGTLDFFVGVFNREIIYMKNKYKLKQNLSNQSNYDSNSQCMKLSKIQSGILNGAI